MSSRLIRKVCRPIAITMQKLGGFRYAAALRAAKAEYFIDREKKRKERLHAAVQP